MSHSDQSVYYSSYLQLDKILDAQHTESSKKGIEAHDEMLFIITHQAFELWFKQIMFELDSVISLLQKNPIAEHEISMCVKGIHRMNKILHMTSSQFEVLETMTALDFMDFRDLLHPASGFQSLQFRILEIRLGLPESKRLNKHFLIALNESDKAQVLSALQKPTLFDSVQQWLENTPFIETDKYTFWHEYKLAVMQTFEKDRHDILQHDILSAEEKEQRIQSINQAESSFNSLFDNSSYQELIQKGERFLSHKATMAALFINLYRSFPLLQKPFELIHEISTFDENMSLWRYRHSVMTAKMIGSRIGTGGSSGSHYLAMTAMKQRIFNDITSLSGMLLSRRTLPDLPADIIKQLQFTFEQ